MPKVVKVKVDYGINAIVDPVLLPDGFSVLVSNLDLRTRSARPYAGPTLNFEAANNEIKRIWEFRKKFYQSALYRTYYGEYRYGQEIVYFTEEGPGRSAPQKIVDGVQADLGTAPPLSTLVVAGDSNRTVTGADAVIGLAGGLRPGTYNYRIAPRINGETAVPCEPVRVSVTNPAGNIITVSWDQMRNVDGYDVFGREDGKERLLVSLGQTTSWDDDGTKGGGVKTAAQFDARTSYAYVYTYYRKVGEIEDESGPSPISSYSQEGKLPMVTRLVLTDGFYIGGYTLDAPSSTITVSKDPATIHDIGQIRQYTGGTQAVITTKTPHGLTTGDKVALMNATPVVENHVDRDAAVPVELGNPGVGSVLITGGSLPTGTLIRWTITAVRGDVATNLSSNPAQTTGMTTWYTPAGLLRQVRFDFNSYSPGTDYFIVYRDGVAVQVVPINVASWTDDGTAVAIPGLSVPSGNETATRCVLLSNLTLDQTASYLVAPFPTLEESKFKLSIPFGPTPFVPLVGDFVYLAAITSAMELNGSHEVLAFNSGTSTATMRGHMKESGPFTDPFASVTYKPGNGHYVGWRLYRVGDTSEFLRVADIGLDKLSFEDNISTTALGTVLPTAYEASGLQVVFNKPPVDLKRIVYHQGMLAGIVDNLVRWTPVGKPDAWPDVFYFAPASKPLALSSYGQGLMVFCENGVVRIDGNTPETMSPTTTLIDTGCVAPFSVQNVAHFGLMWLSRIGIMVTQDGMTARCVTQDKAHGRFFLAPSTLPLDGDALFWMDNEETVHFAEAMRRLGVEPGSADVQLINYDLPMQGEITGIRSFTWDNRYFLFYPDRVNFSRSGMVQLDLHREERPLTVMSLKPDDVHVSLSGDVYMLLRKADQVLP